MKTIWKVLTWLSAACGLTSYFIGWTALIQESTIWVQTEFWFYDAVTAGIFAIFFSVWGKISEKK